MPRNEAFPWDAAMAFGFGIMRLSPREFWAMTPRELAAAMRALGCGSLRPPTRNDLAKLLSRFPDTDTEKP